MGGFVDVDALVKQLEKDMKRSGRGGFRPEEVPGLVRAAVEKLLKVEQKHCFPIKPSEVCTNAIAGESPRRGVRTPSGDRVMDRITGADRSNLRA